VLKNKSDLGWWFEPMKIVLKHQDMGMDQYLLIPFLGG